MAKIIVNGSSNFGDSKIGISGYTNWPCTVYANSGVVVTGATTDIRDKFINEGSGSFVYENSQIKLEPSADLYVDGTVTTTGSGTLNSPFKTIMEAYNAAQTGKPNNIYIMSDMIIDTYNPFWINGKDVTIKSYGETIKTIKRGANKGYVLFNNYWGSKLTLENIIIDGGSEDGIKATAALIGVDWNAQLTLGNGAVLQNNNNTRVGHNGDNSYSSAGAIMVHYGAGEINMNEGAVIKNNNGYSGAVFLYGTSTFNMNGGEIIDNTTNGTTAGVLIWNRDVKLNFNSGKITNNTKDLKARNITIGGVTTNANGSNIKLADTPDFKGSTLGVSAYTNAECTVPATMGVLATNSKSDLTSNFTYEGRGSLVYDSTNSHIKFEPSPDYYVDGTDGNDSTGDGSRDYPYKTIKKAYDTAQIGVPTNIYIMRDITMNGAYNAFWTNNKIVTIKSDMTDSKVKTLKRGTNTGYVFFDVFAGTKLTLENIILDGGSENGIKATAALIGIDDNGQVTLGNGAVLQNNNNTRIGHYGESLISSSGGVIVEDGPNVKLTMEEGSSITNTIGYSGAVFVYGNATLDMNGGTVEKNTTQSKLDDTGAGVFLYHGGSKLNVSGNANISNNKNGNDKENNVFLNTTDSFVNVEDTLNTNGSIGITAKAPSNGRKVVSNASEIGKFKYDDTSQYNIELSNPNIVLKRNDAIKETIKGTVVGNIADLTVTLRNANGDIIEETKTDANGAFSLYNSAPSGCTVVVSGKSAGKDVSAIQTADASMSITIKEGSKVSGSVSKDNKAVNTPTITSTGIIAENIKSYPNGDYDIVEVPVGQREIVASKDGATAKKSVTAPTTESIKIDLTGYVNGNTNPAIKSGIAKLYDKDGKEVGNCAIEDGKFNIPLPTKTDGQPYTVTVSGKGDNGKVLSGKITTDDLSKPLSDIATKEGVLVTGIAKKPTGASVIIGNVEATDAIEKSMAGSRYFVIGAKNTTEITLTAKDNSDLKGNGTPYTRFSYFSLQKNWFTLLVE